MSIKTAHALYRDNGPLIRLWTNDPGAPLLGSTESIIIQIQNRRTNPVRHGLNVLNVSLQFRTTGVSLA